MSQVTSDTTGIFLGTSSDGRQVYPATCGRFGQTVLCGGSAGERLGVMRYLTETYSMAGVPVVVTDCGGTLSSLAQAGFPCSFWDLYASAGLPLRTTVSEMGPLLLSQLLKLNETQSDLLELLFRIADENGLLLIDIKDLKALIGEISEQRTVYEKTYGGINTQSLAVILREVTKLETQGYAGFLGEPAIDVRDLISETQEACGRIHILDMQEAVCEETLYRSFLLYLLSELNETLPEIDADEGPVLCMILDEAGCLFTEDSRSFLVKMKKLLSGLARRGVMVVFAADRWDQWPEALQEQVQEKLFFDGGLLQAEITDADGTVRTADDVTIPTCVSGNRGISDTARAEAVSADSLHEKYYLPFDRDSAYEFLQRRGLAQSTDSDQAEDEAAASESTASEEDTAKKSEDAEAMAKRAKSSAQSLGTTVAGTVGRQIGKSIGENFGSFGSTLGGNIGASLGRGIMNTLFKN